MEREDLALEDADCEAEHVREELDRPHRRGQIPGKPSLRPLDQVLKVTPAGIADMRSGDDLSGDDGLGPGGDRVLRR